MDRFWFVAILAVPVLIGLVNLLRRKRRLIVAEEFANEYFQKLGDYITRPPCRANGRQLTEYKQAFDDATPSTTGVER